MKLLFVTRRYWPLAGRLARPLGQLARALAESGDRVTVLTGRWQQSWPAEIDLPGVRVVRLPYPHRETWGPMRFHRSLAGWLRKHGGKFDLALVAGLKQDAFVTMESLPHTPVVLAPERSGPTGDCHWQLDAHFGRRLKARLMGAAALVATNRAIHNELIAAGYARGRIREIPLGVAHRPHRDPIAQAHCRELLAGACPTFALPEKAPLAVFVGELVEAEGLEHLLQAWRRVAKEVPNARLWLVGEGPRRMSLIGRAQAMGLGPSVMAPGTFDDPLEVLVAADVAVFPALDAGQVWAPLEAMAIGLPTVVTDVPGLGDLVESQREGLVVGCEDPDALAAAIVRLLMNPDEAAKLGTIARQRVRRERPLEAMVAAYRELFGELIEASRGGTTA